MVGHKYAEAGGRPRLAMPPKGQSKASKRVHRGTGSIPEPASPRSAAAKAAHLTKHAGKQYDPALMARFRRLALAYPEAVEVEQFGEPWFKAGKKPFCTYGAEHGKDGAAFNVSRMDQAELVKDPRFERTHYIGQHGWTTMRFAGAVDWDEVKELMDIAYRRVANQRMLRALPA
jgi:predicted DNA-binding protein (MmcQ/YjbR family)